MEKTIGRTQILKQLIKNTGLSMKAFSEKANIPNTTLYSMLERGIGNASVDNVIKVCKALGITIEQLEKMAENQNIEFNNTENNLSLNIPDEYSNKYKVTSRDKKQYEEEMKKANEAFFLNDELSEDTKKEMLDLMSELFWKAKALNKEQREKSKEK